MTSSCFYITARVHRSPARCLIIRRVTPRTLRACSSWRRGRRIHETDKPHSKEEENKGRYHNGTSWRWDQDLPFEPSRREKMWQERMERIRQMVDANAYDALFGYSNRLLRGIPMEGTGWWRREVSFQAPVEVETVALRVDKDSLNAGSGGKRAKGEGEGEGELEYDPISNRMVRKNEKTFSTFGQDLDGKVDIPVKPPKPEVKEHGEARTRSFIMLKEDLASIPREPTPVQPEPIQPESRQISTAREEYERYKSQRLSSNHWLTREGFHNSRDALKTPNNRFILEENFEQLHSGKQELAEDKLITKDLQKSRGTSIPTTAYDEAKADKEILEYRLGVSHQNKQNKDRLVDMEARDDILKYNRQVAKDNFEVEQQGKLMDLKTKVQSVTAELQAISNLATRIKAMEAGGSEAASGVDTSLRSVNKMAAALDTSLQRYIDKTTTATSTLQTSLQRYNKSTTEAVKAQLIPLSSTEQVRTHDPAGYRHHRESRQVQRMENAALARNIPTLAEVFGYKKPAQEISTRTEKKVPSPDLLDTEVESQKAAFLAFESSRKPVVGELQVVNESAVKKLESRKEDTKLVEEIKRVYEEEYGPITTSHVQKPVHPEPEVEAAKQVSTEEVAAEKQASSNEPTPIIIPPPPPQPAAPHPPPATQQLPQPASTLKRPTPSQTATYTILSYDGASKSMTSASFSSLPSPTESVIPLTIALRHLSCASKFLPKLKELREEGFVPVHANRDLLILRKDGEVKAEVKEEDGVRKEIDVDAVKWRERKKLEPVFSGSSRAFDQSQADVKRRFREAKRERRRRFRRVVKYTAAGTVVLGAGIYMAGVGAEVTRGRKVVLRDSKDD